MSVLPGSFAICSRRHMIVAMVNQLITIIVEVRVM